MYVLVDPNPYGTGPLCALYALQCMLIVYSHPIPMGWGSVMGHWALSSVLHALK